MVAAAGPGARPAPLLAPLAAVRASPKVIDIRVGPRSQPWPLRRLVFENIQRYAARQIGRVLLVNDDDRQEVTGRRVRPLDPSTWDAFDELCANSDGFPSGCYCIGFHEEGPVPHAAALNRDRKHERVLAGTTHAALVFDGELCIGWCQFGPPKEVVRIKNRRQYDKTQQASLPDWRIGCNYVRAGYRRQGVATDALGGALGLIAEMGGGRVEAYPEPAEAVPAGFLFHGALSTFDQFGFTRDRMIGKHRWVVSKTIDPT